MDRVLLNVLVDKQLKEEFLKVAKQEGTLGSVLLRQYMKKYVKENKGKD